MNSVQSIVGELLAFDPSLAPHRATLESAVRDILAAKPDTRFTPAFRKRLLAELQSRLPADAHPSYSFPLTLMLQRFLFAGGGAVVGALLVFITLNGSMPFTPGTPGLQLPHAPVSVRDAGSPEAFGSLVPASPNPRPQSGGGGGGGGPEIDGKIAAGMMIAPEGTRIEFAYDGDITLPEGNVDVFRRLPGSAQTSVDSLIGGSFAAQLLDIRKFSGMKAQNITMASGKYSLSADFMDGNVWISRIYAPGERPESLCRDEDCFQRNRLKESDMLPDDRVIAIAESFLREYGIETSSYGEPELMNDWRVWLAAATDPSDFYFPDQVTVLFPLLIDGTPVYEEYGAAYGLQVSVDMRMKEVVSIGNLRLYDLQQSSYAGVSDAAALREALTKGGTFQWASEDAKTATAALGEPSAAYVHVYLWNEQTMQSSELFVPGLQFPVTDMPASGDQSRVRVVLPLAQEMIERINSSPDGRPMPLDTVRY